MSKTWLNGFKKRTTLGANQAAPTAAITCCHGHLMPDQGSKRTPLPPHVFDMLVEYWARDQAATQLAPPPSRKGKGAAAAAAAAAEEEQAGSGKRGTVQSADGGRLLSKGRFRSNLLRHGMQHRQVFFPCMLCVATVAEADQPWVHLYSVQSVTHLSPPAAPTS